MTSYFISDLHLCPEEEKTVSHYLRFLKEIPKKLQHLYILGDFFEAWIGDDDTNEFNKEILTKTCEIKKNGTSISMIVGNRDFLMNVEANEHLLSKSYPISFLDEVTVINSDSAPILLMHGDTLCTDDIEYQKFRLMVRNPQWQQAFLQKSLQERQQIANHLRQESKQKTQNKPENIMDVNQEAVNKVMQAHKATQLIHGHTHRPNVHEFMLDKAPHKRVVLSAWHDGKGSFATLNKSKVELHTY